MAEEKAYDPGELLAQGKAQTVVEPFGPTLWNETSLVVDEADCIVSNSGAVASRGFKATCVVLAIPGHEPLTDNRDAAGMRVGGSGVGVSGGAVWFTQL